MQNKTRRLIPRHRAGCLIALSVAAVVLPVRVPTAIAGQSSPTTQPTPAPGQGEKPWRFYKVRPTAPAQAPNVLLIMTDDVGFAASATFGGPVPTPTFQDLAAHGLRYNEFHTTAMCSPTRAALLTGRNHHSVGFGALADFSIDAPGYDAYIPKSDAIVAQVLKENGYDTAWFGKNHNTPPWEVTSAGPFDNWPNAMGFDYFYGFNAPLTNQFSPVLFENRSPVDPPRHDPGYILDKDLADHAIDWLQRQRNLDPDHPFFLYYAPGTSHAPHQAPAQWIHRFDGQFSQGWDRMREEIFARQKAQGIIPANARLTPRPPQIPAWDSLTADQKRVAARLMQDYTAALAYCDDQIGRVIDALRQSGQLDNTLIIFIQGDNGASAEDLNGTSDDYAALAGIEGDYDHMLAHLNDLGGPKSFENYAVGWAWSMDTPFQWAKEVASHFGGTRNGMVVSWPGHILNPGSIRHQFHHVIDVVPTIYEAAGIRPPDELDHVRQRPLQGVSMLYSFEHPDAPSTHHSQYFEMLGNRAFYKDGWIASTTPEHMPWDHSRTTVKADHYKWELYDLRNDYSQAVDLAAVMPAKLAELRGDFAAAAEQFHIYPLDADVMGRLNPALRPSATDARRHFVYHASTTRYEHAEVPNLRGDWSATIDFTTPAADATGTLAALGDWFGGWGLYLDRGTAVFVYRASDQDRDLVRVAADRPLAAGSHRMVVRLRKSAAAPGGEIMLSVDDQPPVRGSVVRSGYFMGDLFVGRHANLDLIDGADYQGDFPGRVAALSLDIP